MPLSPATQEHQVLPAARRSSEPLRVLHLYAGNLYGGVERMLVTMQRQRAHAPRLASEFACCFAGRLWRELEDAGGVVHDLGQVRLSRPWTVWRARHRLAKLIRQGEYRACVTHSGWLNAVFGPAIRRSDATWACWVHGPLGGQWYERWGLAPRPDALIANSHFTLRTLRSESPQFSSIPAAVVHCPVEVSSRGKDDAVRRRMRESLGCPEGRQVLICSSRLEPLKGHRLLLESLSRLGDAVDWECWIVGGAQRAPEHQYLEGLRAIASAAKIEDRVRFLGQRSDVAELLLAADVHCQPNTAPDSFGIAFIEAMLAELPVVTTRMGGAEEIIEHGRSGLLVEPGQPEPLAAAIRALLQSPELRDRLGSAARERAIELCDPSGRMPDIQTMLLDLLHDDARERSA